MNKDEIFYSLCIEDIQEVANDILERDLSKAEIELVKNRVGDYIKWYDAIESAIYEKIPHKSDD